MPRPIKNRCVSGQPHSVVYKPAGIPTRQLQWVTLALDEYETIRLLDHDGMDQTQAAEQMGVSRPTITRIYAAARKKIADAIVLGYAIRIEGGPVCDEVPDVCPRGRRRGQGRRCRRRNAQNNETTGE